MASFKRHRRAYVDVRSSLPPDELLALAVKVVGAIDGLTVDFRHEAGLRVIRRSIFKVTLMTFAVDVEKDGDGSHARSRIVQAVTSRPTLLTVPVGPRIMSDYLPYLRFMELYAREVRRSDAHAEISLVEVVR